MQKIEKSQKRQNDKQKILGGLPSARKIPNEDVSPEIRTRQTILKVISNEDVVQNDLQVCIDKILNLKKAMVIKVIEITKKKTTEIDAIDQLV